VSPDNESVQLKHDGSLDRSPQLRFVPEAG
jgi:hypothetical protein